MDAKGFARLHSDESRLVCSGAWTLDNLITIKLALKKIEPKKIEPKKIEPKKIKQPEDQLIIDGKAVTQMDSAGAWVLNQYVKKNSLAGLKIRLQNFSEEVQALLVLIEKNTVSSFSSFSSSKSPVIAHLNRIQKLGRATLFQVRELRDFFTFTGELFFEFMRSVFHPIQWRWRELASVINNTGFRALPIIALLSFMIGVVISYQMGNQLRSYGANVFIVNLLGLSVLREFGPLITAIMVAGRTGSAFTAQLGTMKLNQEIDALNTMGVTPGQLLLLPRVIGLFITLPLLTMWANLFGVMGGMLMANTLLGVSPHDFLTRFQHEIPVRALWIGLGKAPVFALLISSIGCFEGMKVRGGADSVGKQTTRSVVLAIFFIIIVDAIFSVIFSKLNL